MPPRMVVVAGPPGSGKSTLLRPDEESLAYFNADERARELNQGSGRKISPEIRAIVNQEFESFIVGHSHDQRRLTYETTLRTASPTNPCASPGRTGSKHQWNTLPRPVWKNRSIAFENALNEAAIRLRLSGSAKYMKRA